MADKLADSVDKTSDLNVEHHVEHHPERNRFEATVAGGTAVLEYMKVGDSLIFTHTEVPESLEGQGVGGALAKAGLEWVRDHNMTAAPLCPFVKAYIKRHPEYQPLVKMGG